MTEAQKRAALATIAEHASIAERTDLTATARSWRERYMNVACRPAGEIIMAASRGEVPEE